MDIRYHHDAELRLFRYRLYLLGDGSRLYAEIHGNVQKHEPVAVRSVRSHSVAIHLHQQLAVSSADRCANHAVRRGFSDVGEVEQQWFSRLYHR